MPTFPPGATESVTPYPWGKKYEITIPAWNDIIHVVVPPTWTSAEKTRMRDVDTQVNVLGNSIEDTALLMGLTESEVREALGWQSEYEILRLRQIEAAIAMSRSPTPELLQNFGTVMTMLDDVQDFATTVGVLSRILGRAFPPANAIAVGAFTIGEFLNKLSLMNQLTGGEKAVVCRFVRDLKKMSTKTTIRADVSKRMKRLFPSKGETLEILQTTDSLFGVGISLGPIVGLIEDIFFGAATNAPTRFKSWTITDRERQAIVDIIKGAIAPLENLDDPTRLANRIGEGAALVIINGEYMHWQDYAKALAAYSDSALATMLNKLRNSFIDVWVIIKDQRAMPKKKTSTETRLLLQSFGIDPYGQDAWPVAGLGADATIEEMMNAMSAQAQSDMLKWRSKLGDSDDGLFLDAIVRDIGEYAARMFTDDGESISTSMIPEAIIYIHALEAGLNPPPDTSIERFTEWNNYVKERMEQSHWDSPPHSLLEAAYDAFFAPQ